MPTKMTADPDQVKQVGTFLNLAFKDYLAARVLINSGLVLQGVILASTCIEKYFKAITSVRGTVLRGHLKAAHFRSLRNIDPKLYNSLNESFLLLLQTLYQLRYADTLEVGFSVSIADRPTLAELDYTVAILERSLKFMVNGVELERRYALAIKESDKNLYLNNYILNNIDKQAFISQEELVVYEIHFLTIDKIYEIEYLAIPSLHDGNFMREPRQRDEP
ncbi:MAG: hypothetical protein ABI835_17070 [Chloroflexota bacterium]